MKKGEKSVEDNTKMSTEIVSMLNISNTDQQSNLEEDLSNVLTRRARPIARILITHSLSWARYSLNRLPLKMTLSNLGILMVVLAIILPRTITYILLYPVFRLVFGNLYPAYASYKAVRTKNVKEYVKWMMYWIVFALFTCAETFTDVFFSFWFPFYYEIKTILVVWLLSPATKGSSILYRRFVHPALIRREAEIDEALARATEQGYTAVLHLGSKGVNYATTVLMQTAIKGGGGLVQHLKKSYSLSDLTGEKEDENRNTPHMHDETDMEVEPRRREHVGRRGYSPRRTQSSSNRVEMYFSEVDVNVRQPMPREPVASLTNIRSSDDISSGYSSGEALQSHRTSQGDSLVRTSSVGARTRAKPRSTTKKTPEDAGEDSDYIDLPSSTNISFPTPLSLVTPDQALEILLLLSQTSNVNDYIKFDRGFPFIGNDDLGNTSQSGPKTELNQSEGTKSTTELIDPASNVTNVQTVHSIEVKAVPTNVCSSNKDADTLNSITDIDKRESKTEIPNTDETIQNSNPIDVHACERDSSTLAKDSVKESNHVQITDEICQHKFDELKQLLSDAHKAVNNIVQSQDKLTHADTTITEILSRKDAEDVHVEKGNDQETLKKPDEDKTDTSSKNEVQNVCAIEIKHNDQVDVNRDDNAVLSDVWATPNVSRSNSDSLERAGKYNKKPAPKVPLSKSEDDLTETESQSALKATLVIKTGTIKTFSNTSTTKDVFFATDAKSKGKKSKRQRTKDGFSKLLTIPKNIFHNAFHKEHKESKADDSSSEVSASDSRSNSIASREGFTDLASNSSTSNQDANVTYVPLQPEDDKIDYVDASTSDTLDTENTKKSIPEKEKTEQVVTADTHSSVKDSHENAAVDTELQIHQMSESPKIPKRMESDIY